MKEWQRIVTNHLSIIILFPPPEPPMPMPITQQLKGGLHQNYWSSWSWGQVGEQTIGEIGGVSSGCGGSGAATLGKDMGGRPYQFLAQSLVGVLWCLVLRLWLAHLSLIIFSLLFFVVMIFWRAHIFHFSIFNLLVYFLYVLKVLGTVETRGWSQNHGLADSWSRSRRSRSETDL